MEDDSYNQLWVFGAHAYLQTQKDEKAIKKDGILRMEGISEHPKQSLEEYCEEHCPGY